MSPTSVEIHVPISPTPTFFTMVRYLAASLRRVGAADAQVVVTVGEDMEPVDLYRAQPWSTHYPIRWRWMDRELFRRYSWQATVLDRFRADLRADVVLMLDSDVLATAPFEDLLLEVQRSDALHGCIAHVSPMTGGDIGLWDVLFEQAGLGSAPMRCEHTGWATMFTDETYRRCPPYFNMGVIAGGSSVLHAVGDSIFEELEHLTAAIDSLPDDPVNRQLQFFRTQLAVTLAIERHQLPWRPLGFRFNFPTYDVIAEAYPEELEDVRFIHYLGSGHAVDKARDFQSPEHVSRFVVRTDLTGIHERFRREVARVHPQVFREDARRAPDAREPLPSPATSPLYLRLQRIARATGASRVNRLMVRHGFDLVTTVRKLRSKLKG